MIDPKGLPEPKIQELIDAEAAAIERQRAATARNAPIRAAWAVRPVAGTVYFDYFHKSHGNDAPSAVKTLSPEPDRPSIARDWEIMIGGIWTCPVCGESLSNLDLYHALGPWPALTDEPMTGEEICARMDRLFG